MKTWIMKASALAGVGLASLAAWGALAEDSRVVFPEKYESGVHYATVNRGNIREELFATPEAIAAAKAGQPLPNGATITMEDYRDGELYRCVVMQKGENWGADYGEERRTGDWQFQWFKPDRTVNVDEGLVRCQSCHQSQASQDFVFTMDRMRQAR